MYKLGNCIDLRVGPVRCNTVQVVRHADVVRDQTRGCSIWKYLNLKPDRFRQ